MALQIPRAGLQLEENFSPAFDHLPTQAFILDLSDDVIAGMIESVNQGNEIRLSLGNKPTFLYGSSSHRIEPTFEDETDDIELFQTNPSDTPGKAERLPQLAMSLFRKPELGNPYAQYRNSSSEEEDEDEEYDEVVSSPEPDDAEQQPDDALNSDIALLRNSLAQKEAEKIEKSARVIEGNAPAPNGKSTSKRTGGSLQKALSERRSPFGRASLSPLPTSPALSAAGSPSLAPADTTSQQAAERIRQARSPIIHELAFKEQSYDLLWQKYPGSSETEFKNALEKVGELDKDTGNYFLRKKYWRELDVWRHDYASEEERQQAIHNAVRQFDKMRLSTAEPEWEKLQPYDKRGQGLILSKVQVSIAKGPAAPKIRVQKADDSGAEHGSSNGGNDSGENGSGSNRTDEEGAESEATLSPTRQTATANGAAKKKTTAREAQEKRLLSTKKKSTTTSAPVSAAASPSVKISPVKVAAARPSSEKQNKFKSKEFISDSDSSDSESESAPLSTTVHQSKLAASTTKSSALGATPKTAASKTAPTSSSAKDRVAYRDEERSTPPAAPIRKAKPSPVKESVRPQITAKPLAKKRPRDSDDDDSSSGSSSGTPLSKRIKPLKSAPRPSSNLKQSHEKYHQSSSSSHPPPPPQRASNASPNGSSSSSSSGGHNTTNHFNSNTNANGTSSSSSGNKHKNNTSPVKSSPLASSPPTNASELDLSSEGSVPPIGTSNTSRKRKMADDRRNALMGGSGDGAFSSSKTKKQRHLPEDLVEKALRFKAFYEKYEALYRDIASRANPPKDRVADLLKMHHRLQDMKSDIHNEAMMRA